MEVRMMMGKRPQKGSAYGSAYENSLIPFGVIRTCSGDAEKATFYKGFSGDFLFPTMKPLDKKEEE